jgi:glycerol-3-phosphate acyltransferase PlsY
VFGFPLLLGIFIVSFVLGSIPNGLLVGKLFYHTDIRAIGSGNIGTTNAIRAMGKKAGYAVFLLDFGKGVLSGLLALWIPLWFAGASPTDAFTAADGLTVAFAGCVFGHIFSPWLGFRGGKGIAVAVGCLFVTFGPIGACIELALFVIVVVVSKYVSAGSLAAAALNIPMAAFYFHGDWLAICLCCAAAFAVIWAHRENIRRLRAGTESRIGDKKRSGGDRA